MGAEEKSGLWHSEEIALHCMNEREQTAAEKNIVNNFKCAIAHNIDSTDLVTWHQPKQSFPKQDLYPVLSKSSPNTHLDSALLVFSIRNTVGLPCYKNQPPYVFPVKLVIPNGIGK